MSLSQNFHVSEFVKSNDAVRLGIDNTPTPQIVSNLTALCENVLEPIRSNFGQPVRVSSGYRSPTLNAAVGGASSSQHVLGMAADIEIYDIDNCELAQWIANNLTFDQLILEFHNHSAGANDGWVHVSYNTAGNRNQILTAKKVNGKTAYLNGLVP